MMLQHVMLWRDLLWGDRDQQDVADMMLRQDVADMMRWQDVADMMLPHPA